MLLASKKGILFRTTEEIKKMHPELPCCDSYEDLMKEILSAC